MVQRCFLASTMTLLEVIKKASASSESHSSKSDYPIILNPDDVIVNLKPKLEDPDPFSLINPVDGWKISEADSKFINSSKNFYGNLSRKLKNPNKFGKEEFVGTLITFLETVRSRFGIPIPIDSTDSRYTRVIIEKAGCLMDKDVADLVLEACIVLEVWDILETLIVNELVKHSSYSTLITKLAVKNRPDLLSLCIVHASDFGVNDLLCIFKYFLLPPKDGYENMINVRKEWESQAILALEKATDKNLKGKKSNLAKESSILLMLANDGFAPNEMCLHYLLASPNLDEVILSSVLSKLNDRAMLAFTRYLGKWLKKYERFPQAGPCPKASTLLGLKACDWVPKLEDIVRCLSLVLDNNFSSLVLNKEILAELSAMEVIVKNLASEANLCCFVADIAETLRIDGKGV